MPVVRLTQRFADDLLGAEPPERDVIYWSDRVTGLGAKHKAGSGRVSWCIQWRDGKSGRSHRLAIGDAGKVKAEAAEKAARALFGDIAAGKNPATEKRRHRRSQTFKEFIDNLYLKSDQWRKKAPSTHVSDLARIRRYLVPAFGDRRLLEISVADVRRLHRELVDPEKAAELARKAGATKAVQRGGEGGARRTMRLLKAILAYAVEEAEIVDNPAAGLRLGSDGERDLVPDAGAYDRFWQALDRLRATADTVTMRRAMDAIALIALTGARKGEIQRLRWRHVDLDSRRLVLGRDEHKAGRKTRKTRIISLPEDAVAILSGYVRGEPDALVFAGLRPNSPIALQRPWERLAIAADLPAGITPHSLRHGVGTILAAAGLSAVQIAQALGHNQWRTSERYVHTVDLARAELAQRTADLVRPKKLRAAT